MSKPAVFHQILTLVFLSFCCVPAFAEDIERDGAVIQVGGEYVAGEPRVVFVNGMKTAGDRLLEQARSISKRLDRPVTLVVNRADRVIDLPAVVIAKAADFEHNQDVNAATRSVFEITRATVLAGDQIHLIGYSMGSILLNNATRELSREWRDHPERLRSVRVITLGGAVFDNHHCLGDGWPSGLGSLLDISDVRDPVAQWWGTVPHQSWYGDKDESRHVLCNYIQHLSEERLTSDGNLLINDQTVILERKLDEFGPLIRVRVANFEGEESRSTPNLGIPDEWKRVDIDVIEAPAGFTFVPMREDIFLWFDQPGDAQINSRGAKSIRKFDYIGRSRGLIHDETALLDIRPERHQ